MKIGNKYHYFKNTPTLPKNATEDEKFVYRYCYFLNLDATKNSRSEKIRITEGSTVYIERWDGNGIHSEVKVLEIKEHKDFIEVKCDKGYFNFGKENSKTENIEFNWTCEGKEWEKQNQKWINGKRYYYENKS